MLATSTGAAGAQHRRQLVIVNDAQSAGLVDG
jgi:hypothetical protein